MKSTFTTDGDGAIAIFVVLIGLFLLISVFGWVWWLFGALNKWHAIKWWQFIGGLVIGAGGLIGGSRSSS